MNHFSSKIKILNLCLVIILFLNLLYCSTKKDNSTENLVKLILLAAILNPSCGNGKTTDSGSDPLYTYQWHLYTDGTKDAGVITPWNDGNYGKAVTFAVVDDGIETGH